MRVGALYAAGCLRERSLCEDARGCLDDPDAHVRETARWAAARLAGGDREDLAGTPRDPVART
jgi:hypothetical protein